MKGIREVLSVSALLFACRGAVAIDDGPRGYQLVPEGTNAITVIGLFQEGNQSFSPGTALNEANIDITVGLFQYTHSMNVAGNLGALFAILPVGKVSGSLDTELGELEGVSNGIGDFIVGGVIGLVGTPALSRAEWAAYDPGLSIGLLGKVYAPTGEFSGDKIINFGADRWAGQIGAPISYYIGTSMLDPELATIELVPSVTYFSDSGDTAQDPILVVEGHVTRNLDSRFWASIDALYVYGGETSTDGVSNDDTQESLALGGTVGVNVTPSFSMKFSYGEFVYHNTDGLDGHSFRVVSNFVF
jgi:hypothetical protein